jgi:WD domain, G-beta repeat/WD40-like Beta Propeller Repeat
MRTPVCAEMGRAWGSCLACGRLPSDAFVTRLRGLVGGDALPVLTRDGQRRVDTLSGHALAVNAVDWSPDGRRIVSASNDNALRIWDASTGRTERVLTGHTGSVNAVAWSPNESLIVSASADGTARISNSTPGLLRGVVHRSTLKHPGSAYSVSWSPDGNSVVTASDQLRTWDPRGVAPTMPGCRWRLVPRGCRPLTPCWHRRGRRTETHERCGGCGRRGRHVHHDADDPGLGLDRRRRCSDRIHDQEGHSRERTRPSSCAITTKQQLIPGVTGFGTARGGGGQGWRRVASGVAPSWR